MGRYNSVNVNVYAEVDPDDVLNELPTDDIIGYLNRNRDVHVGGEYDKDVNAEDYWHGDLDLKKLLKDIGPDEVKKIIIDELSQESGFEEFKRICFPS